MIWQVYLNSSQNRRKNYPVSFQEELKYRDFVTEFVCFFICFFCCCCYCCCSAFPLAFSYWFEQATNHKLPHPIWTLIKHHQTPKIQTFLSSVLFWLLHECMFNLIANHKTPCISVFSNFSHYNQSHVTLSLSGKQTLPLSQSSNPLSPAVTQAVAL